MVIDQSIKYREMANRGKYRMLYTHLVGLANREWRATFREIESVIGFDLPPSARRHRPWWSNWTGGHSQSIAWSAAGWETAEVDMDSETLLFRRKPAGDVRSPSIDEVWPVRSVGIWPEGLSLRREDIYG